MFSILFAESSLEYMHLRICVHVCASEYIWVYLCASADMCACIWEFMGVHLQIFVHVWVYIYIYIYICVCVCACVYLRICVNTCVNLDMCVCLCDSGYLCMCVRAHLKIHGCVHVYLDLKICTYPYVSASADRYVYVFSWYVYMYVLANIFVSVGMHACGVCVWVNTCISIYMFLCVCIHLYKNTRYYPKVQDIWRT